MKMTIIDCGVGNLFSIECALKNIGLNASISSTVQGLRNVDAIVLPGVGNFKAGAQNLQLLRSDIFRLVEEGIPLLGVCLGMQLLFQQSEEGLGSGLGLFEGRVVKLPNDVKAPHMGWNTLKVYRPTDLLDGIDKEDYFYFVHSYYASPTNRDVIVAETDYGLSFTSVAAKGNIYGTQFHPEKSGKPGERMLRNFTRIVKK